MDYLTRVCCQTCGLNITHMGCDIKDIEIITSNKLWLCENWKPKRSTIRRIIRKAQNEE